MENEIEQTDKYQRLNERWLKILETRVMKAATEIQLSNKLSTIARWSHK